MAHVLRFLLEREGYDVLVCADGRSRASDPRGVAGWTSRWT